MSHWGWMLLLLSKVFSLNFCFCGSFWIKSRIRRGMRSEEKKEISAND